MATSSSASLAASHAATSALSYATSFLSTAAAYVPRPTSIASNYVVLSSPPPFSVGVWKVERAVKDGAGGKEVSVWTVEKAALGRGEKGVETVRKEVQTLGRLRHPCILEMREAMEETRSTITFATEPIISSLLTSIHSSASASHPSAHSATAEVEELELDEVEIQKGMSQVGQGLAFIHNSVGLVHGNLTPEAVVVNLKGDWKLSSFGLSAPLLSPKDGSKLTPKWEFLNHDPSLPKYLQRDWNYVAPEYFLAESPPSPAQDLYSLGCILHYIHLPSLGPPYDHSNSMSRVRGNFSDNGLGLAQLRRLPPETQTVIRGLLERSEGGRLTAEGFLGSGYFNNVLVSTLRFLDPTTFSTQSTESQTSFLRGLLTVLPRFSKKVREKKILPALLEECRKNGLVPWLLPVVVEIGKGVGKEQFQTTILPSLKPLFGLKDPPQAVLALLDNLGVFVENCSSAVFREEVMPLVYGALDSDNAVILEKALKVVPGLAENLDYTTVKGSLFPKVTAVFTKTTLLSVKVNTLICFHSMIPLLDKYTLTEKLVPLLSKIKTKEPSVMIATLAVHEEIGKKCEVDAIASLILPQLWQLSMAPLLNLTQFEKFMRAIKVMSKRVEEEHGSHLKELKRLEESASVGNGGGGEVDFESLVRGQSTSGTTIYSSSLGTPSIVPTNLGYNSSSSGFNNSSSPYTNTSVTKPLGARPIPPSSSSFSVAPPPPPVNPFASFSTSSTRTSGLNTFAALQPSRPSNTTTHTISNNSTGGVYGGGKPNYNISLSSTPTPRSQPSSYSSQPQIQSSYSQQPPPQQQQFQQQQPIKWNVVPPPPGFQTAGTVLQPTILSKPSSTKNGFGDWGDLDPLS